MDKARAIEMLGGTQVAAAAALGITQGAVAQWPDPLPRRIADSVIALLARRYLRPELLGLEPERETASSVTP
jgi:hypothetical protein